jgi:hypothetical protein
MHIYKGTSNDESMWSKEMCAFMITYIFYIVNINKYKHIRIFVYLNTNIYE